MLNSIQRDVALLRKGPFLAGGLLLSEAARWGPPTLSTSACSAAPRTSSTKPRRWPRRLKTARSWNSIRAWSGWRSGARRRPALAQESYQSARIVIDTLAKQLGDVKVLHSRWSTAALTYLYPVGVFVIPAKLKKIWDAERARDAIQSFLPFLRCVAESLNIVSQSDPVPALALTHSASDGFVLGEVPV